MKVVYIVSNVSKAVAFEWIAKELPKRGVEPIFILLNNQKNTALSDFLEAHQIESYHFDLPSKTAWPFLILKLRSLLRRLKVKYVHTHLFEASLLGLLAAKLAGIKNRIYTRHHSTYHHDYFPKAIRYDRWINSLASKVIAISPNVKEVLVNKEGVPREKVVLIPHGFDLEKFEKDDTAAVNSLRKKYNSSQKSPIVGCISRYVEWKGVDYIVKAFATLLNDYPDALLLIFNAGGPFEKEVKSELMHLPKESFREIAFENDLFSIYPLFDIYVHTPIDSTIEAFGQTYVEALAAGVPSIFTISGISKEFIEHEKNALVVPYKDSKAITIAIHRLLTDNELRESMIHEGKSSIAQYSLPIFIDSLAAVYKEDKAETID